MRDIKENKISNNFFNFSTFFNTEILFTKRFSKNDILFKQFLIKHIVTTDEKKLEIKENEIKKGSVTTNGWFWREIAYNNSKKQYHRRR